MKRIILILPALFLSFIVEAQDSLQTNSRALFQSNYDATVIQEPGQGMTNLDSLLNIWYIQKALYDSAGVFLYEEEEVPVTEMSDSIFIRRLNNMATPISLPYNDIVRNHIVFYLKRPSMSEIILGLSQFYFPLFEQIFDVHNVPLEIKSLAVVESALNPVAVSRVGATGIWQFMLGTGKRFDLTITSYVDERRDPIASTHAAAKYLNYLNTMFNDWTLALAAYNCGEGNVLKAIKRSGGKTDYWEIYPYLPRETRNYVPAFVAASYMVRYYKEHKLIPKEPSLPARVDTFMVSSNLHFRQISDVIGLPVDELRDLNPQYKKDIVPGIEKPYELRVPIEYTMAFIEKETEIYGHKEKEFFNTDIVVNPAGLLPKSESPVAGNTSKSTSGRKQTIYRVKKGENLATIAEKNNVKLTDLCYWNNLKKTSMIHPNQKIIIYTSGSVPAAAEVVSDASKKTQKKAEIKQPTTHTVKKGETLWGISQKYDNVSFNELLKLNGLTEKSKVQAGQVIKLPK